MNRCAVALMAAVLFAGAASAFDPLDVTTLDGQTYKQVSSAKVVGDKAMLTYADGIASVPLKALSDEVREKLGLGALDALTAENKTLRAELKRMELRVAALEKENADLRAKLSGKAGTGASSPQRAAFEAQLTDRVPDWKEIAAKPGFKSFLAMTTPDSAVANTHVTYGMLLDKAQRNCDAAGAAWVFEEWRDNEKELLKSSLQGVPSRRGY